MDAHRTSFEYIGGGCVRNDIRLQPGREFPVRWFALLFGFRYQRVEEYGYTDIEHLAGEGSHQEGGEGR
jgi:hypothetical protein